MIRKAGMPIHLKLRVWRDKNSPLLSIIRQPHYPSDFLWSYLSKLDKYLNWMGYNCPHSFANRLSVRLNVIRLTLWRRADEALRHIQPCWCVEEIHECSHCWVWPRHQKRRARTLSPWVYPRLENKRANEETSTVNFVCDVSVTCCVSPNTSFFTYSSRSTDVYSI